MIKSVAIVFAFAAFLIFAPGARAESGIQHSTTDLASIVADVA